MGTYLQNTSQALARIATLNPKLRAFLQTFDEEVLACAQALDDTPADSGVWQSLKGMPISLKDAFAIQGRHYSFGSRVPDLDQFSGDADVVAKLKEAGALLLGVNSLVEFALGAWGTNAHQETPWNPHDKRRHRVAGGSSSGSAVAVAAGLVSVAIGTDTGGSVRIPAALCGVLGFKPTYGAISTVGAATLNPSFDTVGILSLDIDDLIKVFKVLRRGYHNEQSSTVLASGNTPTIGYIDPDVLTELQEDVRFAYLNALEILRAAGLNLYEARLPEQLRNYHALCGRIMAYESYRTFGHIAERHADLIDPAVLARILQGRDVPDREYQMLLRTRAAHIEAFTEVLMRHPFIVSPTTPMSAPLISDVDETQAPLSTYTRFVNYLGLCAISLPLPAPKSLPIGIQVIAGSGQDNNLLAFARRLLPQFWTAKK